MSDPFRVEGPTAISFSGGRTSAYMLWRVLQSNGGMLPNECVVLFANTGKEEEATLRFVAECSRRWCVPIVWVEYRSLPPKFAIVSEITAARNGEPFESCIKAKSYLPNPVTRFCTIELKIRTMARYLVLNGFARTMDEAENMSMIGIRADEPRRVAKITDKSRVPLALADITSTHIQEFWAAQPFNLELPSFRGRTLAGNCDLCFLKPANQIQTLIAEKPERAIWWAKMEALADSDFASKRKGDGWRFRMDRASYAAMLQNTKDQTDAIGYSDEEPISCFCGD